MSRYLLEQGRNFKKELSQMNKEIFRWFKNKKRKKWAKTRTDISLKKTYR